MRQLVIGGKDESLWVGLFEEQRLVEWRNRHEDAEPQVGEIYQARVTDVLPAIQSAFVEIGQGKKAYMYVDDAPIPKRATQAKANIRECVHEGEMLLVQITKEATDTKAPKVTARLNFQGRYLVFLPHEEGIAVSRKIRDSAIRQRLQTLLGSSLAPGEGVIVRTEAAEVAEELLQEELAYLRQIWQHVVQQAQATGKVGRICREAEWVEQVILEFLPLALDEVLVEDAAVCQQVKSIFARLEPTRLAIVRHDQGKEPLESRLSVDVQLQQALQRQVPLPGGGYLVIDRTEAMTVIDVNTGSFTGKGGQQREQAVTATNLEAAKAIAGQLRLRDIGGIILIDFIDMKEAANKERLLTALKQELARDSVPSTVLGITALGLVEMTRKRVRPSLAERLSSPCEACKGKGRVWSAEQMTRMLWNELNALARTQEAEAAVVEVPATIYHFIVDKQAGATDAEESKSASMRKKYAVTLHVLPNPDLSAEEYRILYAGSNSEAERLYANHFKQMP